MPKIDYNPQSRNWAAFTLVLPDEKVRAFQSGAAVLCDLMVARDGGRTIVRASEGADWFLREFEFSGQYELLRGKGEFFLADGGGWSGGRNLKGFIALKPGALVRYGAKGRWNYLVCKDEGIVLEAHDPRLFEEGSRQWKSL